MLRHFWEKTSTGVAKTPKGKCRRTKIRVVSTAKSTAELLNEVNRNARLDARLGARMGLRMRKVGMV